MNDDLIETYLNDSRFLVKTLTDSVRAVEAGEFTTEETEALRAQILESIEMFQSHLRELDEMDEAEAELEETDGEAQED